MAKEKAEKGEDEANEFLVLNEAERLEAILKVRKAFEELDTYPDRIEANARRVKLLEIWNKLIRIRGTEPIPANEEDGDAEPKDATEAQHLADPNEPLNEIDAAKSLELSVDPEVEVHEKGETVLFDDPTDELNQHAAQSFPELLHHVKVEQAIQDEVLTPQRSSAEDFIGPMPQKHLDPSQDIELERVRLKLIKNGLLHETILPAGTIIAVIPVDAHHILESGMAEYATASD